MRVWNAHWAFHSFAPSVMVDNFDIHQAEYGLWRQNFDKHAYRGLRMTDVSIEENFNPKGAMPSESDFPKPLAPVDDLPPLTVITFVGKPVNGKITVRGTTSDTGPVKRVQVNGRDARALRPNFAEWETVVDAPASKLVVRSEDAAGNIA